MAMNFFGVRLWWWEYCRGPRYRAGQTVRNRFALTNSSDEILARYLGPYVSLNDEKQFIITEHWMTVSGNYVAVGYFWKLIV